MLILKIIPPNDHKAIFITFNNMSHDSMGFKFYQNKAFPALGIYLREHCKFRADDHILYLTKGEFIDRVEMIMDKESFDNAYSKTLLNNFKP